MAGLCVAVCAGLALYWLPRLPAVIPTRFGMGGQVLATGPRATVLFIAGIALALFLMMLGIERLPSRLFNYPWAITEENAAAQHANTRLMLASLNVLIAAFWIIVIADWIQTANGGRSAGGWPLVAFLVLMTGLIVGFVVRGWRLR